LKESAGNPSLDHKPYKPPATIRLDARLDAMTRQKVDDLATRFHRWSDLNVGKPGSIIASWAFNE
jgi:hypothetical protein